MKQQDRTSSSNFINIVDTPSNESRILAPKYTPTDHTPVAHLRPHQSQQNMNSSIQNYSMEFTQQISQTQPQQIHEIYKRLRQAHNQLTTVGQNKASKSTTLLMKQAQKAVTLQDILKAKKFYNDDSSVVEELKHNSTSLFQLENQNENQRLIQKDPKKLERALNKLREKSLSKAQKDPFQMSQTIDTAELLASRKQNQKKLCKQVNPHSISV